MNNRLNIILTVKLCGCHHIATVSTDISHSNPSSMGTKKGQNKNPFLFTSPIPIYPVQAQKNLADGERVYIYHAFSMLTFMKYYEMNNQTQISRSSSVGCRNITTVSHHITHTNTSSLGKKKRTRKKNLSATVISCKCFQHYRIFSGKIATHCEFVWSLIPPDCYHLHCHLSRNAIQCGHQK